MDLHIVNVAQSFVKENFTLVLSKHYANLSLIVRAVGDTANYKTYRNKISTLTRLSKQQYYSQFFNDNLTNMKKTWEGINNVLARKLKNTKPITSIKVPTNNDSVTCDQRTIANVLNDHFASIGPK